MATAIVDYKNFYFNEYFELSPKVLDLVSAGVISLHNSWTPSIYRQINNKVDFLSLSIPISSLLKFILHNNTSKSVFNSLNSIESYLTNKLDEKGISYKNKYFKNLFVIDFFVPQGNFAFDIGVKGNKIKLDFIARNIDVPSVHKLPKFSNNIFHGNKTLVIESESREEILSEILEIYGEFINKDCLIENANIL